MQFSKKIDLNNVNVVIELSLLTKMKAFFTGGLVYDSAIRTMMNVHEACSENGINNAILLKVDGKVVFSDDQCVDDDIAVMLGALKDHGSVDKKLSVMLEHEEGSFVYVINIDIEKNSSDNVNIIAEVHGQMQNPIEVSTIEEYKSDLAVALDDFGDELEAEFRTFCEGLKNSLEEVSGVVATIDNIKPKINAPVKPAEMSAMRQSSKRKFTRCKRYPRFYYDSFGCFPEYDFFDYMLWYMIYDGLFFDNSVYDEYDFVDLDGVVLDEPYVLDEAYADELATEEQDWVEADAASAEEIAAAEEISLEDTVTDLPVSEAEGDTETAVEDDAGFGSDNTSADAPADADCVADDCDSDCVSDCDSDCSSDCDCDCDCDCGD